MTDAVIAGVVSGGLAIVGSTAAALIASAVASGKLATKVEEGFSSVNQRLDSIDKGQSDQWSVINESRRKQIEHEGRISYLEGAHTKKANGHL